MQPHDAYVIRHGSDYPPGWEALERRTKKTHPYCAFCGAKEKLEVHHITPVHVNSTHALDPTNLIVLCSPCHLREGHLGDFERCYDPKILERANANLGYIREARKAFVGRTRIGA